MSNQTDYSAQLAWSDEDGGYIATIVELPGCSAFGFDREDAMTELSDAVKAWISAAKAAGNPIPPPRHAAD